MANTMTRAEKRELDTKAEFALMGMVMLTGGHDEDAKHILGRIASAVGSKLTKDEMWSMITECLDMNTTEVYGISCSTVGGMKCANIILKTKGEFLNLYDEDGVFCYVLNFDAPDYSELGYSYFEKKGMYAHRVA